MTAEPTIDQFEALREKLMDLEMEAIMDDSDKLMALVYDHVVSTYENMGLNQILEMAEYHGVEVK